MGKPWSKKQHKKFAETMSRMRSKRVHANALIEAVPPAVQKSTVGQEVILFQRILVEFDQLSAEGKAFIKAKLAA